MSRPAGLSDSESEDDFMFSAPTSSDYKKGKIEDIRDVNKENEFDTKLTNYVVEPNNRINPTYNDERVVYLSTDNEKQGKKSPSQPRSRKVSPLPFGHIRMAIIQGNLPIVESLIQKGISLDQTIKSGWTILMVAASSAQDIIVKYLLEKGSDPNLHKTYFTALMAAAASDRSEDKVVSCVKQLIDYNADIDASETHGMTALMFAAKAGKPKVLEVLLGSGAAVDKYDSKGLTALFWAASANHNEAVKLLLKYSADPKQIAMGQNVIESALASGNKEMALLLEKHCRGTLDNKDWENLSDLEQNNIVYDTKDAKGSSFQDVEMVLTSIGAEIAIPIFKKFKISLTDFMHLTENDLNNMEITQFGTRFNIMTAIKEINVEEWKKSSLPEILDKECITLRDSIAMIRNMDTHIRCMSATFGWVRQAVENYPQLFNIERNSADSLHLSDSCFSYLKNVNGLKSEIEELREFLKKECNNKDYAPADIVTHRSDKTDWKRVSLLSLGILATFSTLVYFFKPKIFSKFFIESIPQTHLFVDLAK